MKNFKQNLFKIGLLAMAPMTAFAQTTNKLCGPIKYTKSLQWYLCEFYKLIGNYLVPILMLAAFGYFLYGMVQFLRYTNNKDKRAEYRVYMTWGVVALAVIVSVWGIIYILGNIFGVNTTVIPQIKY